MVKRPLRVAVAASTVLALGILTACSSGDSTSDGASGDTPVVTVNYAAPTEQSVFEAGEKVVIDAFVAANPDVKVEVELIPLANYNTKLTTEFRGGGGPDIGRVNHTDIRSFAAGGFLAPLDDAIAANNIAVDKLIPGLVDVGQYGDDQVTLPLTTDTRVLYYNPRLLEAQGIVGPPATWEELVADVAKFAGTDVYGYGLRSDNDYSFSYETTGPYMVQAGGELIAPKGEGAEAVAATSDGTIAAVELIQDIVKTGAVPPGVGQFSEEAIGQLFGQDKLAFTTGGPWLRTQIQAVNPEFVYGTDFATAPIPVREAGQSSGSTAGGWQIGVFENSNQKEAAGRLLAFMMQPENLATLNAVEAFPPTKDGLSNEPWASDPFYDAFRETLPGSSLPILPVARMAEVSAAFQNILEPYVVDPSKPASEGLAAFDDEVNSTILN